MFKPTQILNQYKVTKIFFQDNRVIVVASLQSDINEKDKEIKIENEEEYRLDKQLGKKIRISLKRRKKKNKQMMSPLTKKLSQ